MNLDLLAGEYALYRFAAGRPLPDSLDREAFCFMARTDEELSVMVRASLDLGAAPVSHWRALKVEGPLDLALTGIMAELSAVLAGAGVPLFPVATHDTDYLFVPAALAQQAAGALSAAGHRVSASGRDREQPR